MNLMLRESGKSNGGWFDMRIDNTVSIEKSVSDILNHLIEYDETRYTGSKKKSEEMVKRTKLYELMVGLDSRLISKQLSFFCEAYNIETFYGVEEMLSFISGDSKKWVMQ